jgi:urease accessory protein
VSSTPTPPLRLVRVLVDDGGPASRSLFLAYEQRARTRYRATLSDGSDAVVLLDRGTIVRPGTRLGSEDGAVVEVVAASEQVYRVTARGDDPDPAHALMRGAYHLGNRHVPVELGRGMLKLERDPVLRDLLLRLGLDVVPAFEAFDPEAGAYGGGHRHDTDTDGGSIGEALSRDAHAARSPAPAS